VAQKEALLRARHAYWPHFPAESMHEIVIGGHQEKHLDLERQAN
jgi:hypothetical protein